MKRISEETVKALARTGRQGDVRSVAGLPAVSRVGWEPWRVVLPEISNDEILSVAKGLHLAALNLPGWQAGSVTPVKLLLAELESREAPHLVVEFARWASNYPDLYYGPFVWAAATARRTPEWASLDAQAQVQRAKQVQAQVEIERAANRQRRVEAATIPYIERRQTWEGSPASRKTAFQIQRIQQRLTRADHAREIQEIEELSPAARLASIASRRDRTLMYWPARFAGVSKPVLRELSPESRLQLFLAARQVHGGGWKALQRRLAELGLVDLTEVRALVEAERNADSNDTAAPA